VSTFQQGKTVANPVGRGTALLGLDDDHILMRLAAGDYVITIARELGVAGSSLSRHFKGDPRYRDALEDGAETRLARAEDDLRGANAPIDVMRGTAVWKAVAWRCEKEHPDRWGGKPQVVINAALTMDAALGDAAANLMKRIRRNEAGHQLIEVEAIEALDERGNPV
jgi:AcrR family transcriptional regulator